MTQYPEEFLEILEYQAAALDLAVEVFQELQARAPRPSPEQVEEVRRGERPMTREEYLLARLQRIVVTLENVASDLRLDLEHGFEPPRFDVLEIDVNALVAAVVPDHE